MCKLILIFLQKSGKLSSEEVICMNRTAINQMLQWKNSPERKPLVLKGARQVGKTWLMKEFGRLYYDEVFYFNFDEEDELKSIFQSNKDANHIIELLGLLKGKKIMPEKHLIIFDEVQECPEALNSLKYFCENAKDYHVVSAGSLLGTLLAQPKSYPVGKVDLLSISPMSFEEFLEATNEGLYAYLDTIENGVKPEAIFHSKLLEAYNYYLIIGGMPECVSAWIKYRDYEKVDKLQNDLIDLYENDFSKHNGKVNSGRILMVFRSIVTQLAKDNEKFIYGCIKEGARAREFEEAIEWLVSAGMVLRIHNVSKPEHPLNAFEQSEHFKLFMFDVGLLKHMAAISNEAILLKSDYQFKGALTENYVLQQIRDQFDTSPKYYAPTSTGEIDFVVQDGMRIVPIEVKAGENVASASFKSYIKKFSPETAVRISKLGYEQNDSFVNIPLYLAGRLKRLI